MHPRPDRSLIARLLASSHAPGQVAALRQRCWPGGATDRTEPLARGWLRRWKPMSMAPVDLGCSCAAGRCPVCN